MTLLKACRLPPKRSMTPLPRNINLIKVDRCKGSCHLLGSRMQWMNKLIYHSSTSEKPSAAISKSGTMVTVHNPFSNLPVRRQVTCNQQCSYSCIETDSSSLYTDRWHKKDPMHLQRRCKNWPSNTVSHIQVYVLLWFSYQIQHPTRKSLPGSNQWRPPC